MQQQLEFNPSIERQWLIYFDSVQIARRYESVGQWGKAAEYWRKSITGSGDQLSEYKLTNAKACETIANSVRVGDMFRERVRYEAGEEPNKSENAHAWVKWYNIMSIIYKQIYN